MNLNTDGLVIKENVTGESDRVVTLLTRDFGIIRAFVRGAKTVKSRSVSATQLLAYSKFSVYRGRDAYIVDDAKPIDIFFKLREDIERMSLAQYFCEIAAELAPQESDAGEYLSVVLNSLYLLSEGKRPQPLLKAVTEMRLLCLAGYMPNLVACEKCGKYEDEKMFFDSGKGVIYCSSCAESGTAVSLGVITAMRYICFSEPKKIYNFTLSDDGLGMLEQISENYLLLHIQRNFKTLSFYKSLRGM